MDTFMDKLSNKMTAQELMKANMEADAEEMNTLKGKVKEYNECLEQMQKLVADSVNRLENAQVDSGEINRLVEAAINRINEVQRDTEFQINAEVQAVLENLKVELTEKPDDFEELKSLLNERPGDSEELKTLFSEKMEVSSEYVHKECVKVYRNVQAVIKDENSKVIDSLGTSLREHREKLKSVYNLAAAGLLFSIIGILLQILNLLAF